MEIFLVYGLVAIAILGVASVILGTMWLFMALMRWIANEQDHRLCRPTVTTFSPQRTQRTRRKM